MHCVLHIHTDYPSIYIYTQITHICPERHKKSFNRGGSAMTRATLQTADSELASTASSQESQEERQPFVPRAPSGSDDSGRHITGSGGPEKEFLR